jgi:hypothetical protein
MATIGAITYTDSQDGFEPYHYEDELRVLPLLGRDPALTDKNEVLQANARAAQVCTFHAIAEGESAKAALVALWATQTTHDAGDGLGARNVTVISVKSRILVWSSSTPIYDVEIVVRTR